VSDLDPFAKGGGPPAAALTNVGDSVAGTIIKVEYRQDTDLATGETKRFPDGNPKPVIVVYLKNGDEELRDFVKGRSVSEFRQKVWAVEGEGEGPKPGAQYKREVIRVDPPKRSGFSGEKIFEVTYSSPSEDTRELV